MSRIQDAIYAKGEKIPAPKDFHAWMQRMLGLESTVHRLGVQRDVLANKLDAMDRKITYLKKQWEHANTRVRVLEFEATQSLCHDATRGLRGTEAPSSSVTLTKT